MKIKVTYIISNINKAIAFEWIIDRINRDKIGLSFILLNKEPSHLFRYLRERDIEAYEIPFYGKKDLPLSIVKCTRLLKKIKPDAVHCHLFEADLTGLTAAWLCGIKKRIYTRHHSTFHFDYFPKAVKWDRYCNRMATHIVAISETVKDLLIRRESVNPAKIRKIYHGFDLKGFSEPNPQVVRQLRDKYNPAGQYPVVGVISRLVELKGVQYVVPAFGRLLKKYPNARLLLFNAKGDYEKSIDALLSELPGNSYQKIIFEENITALYHIFDLMLHVPVNKDIEAFGQTYIECLASGVPLIATRSGIGNEILKDQVNCILVPYKDPEAIFRAMTEILENPDLINTMRRGGFSTIEEDFTVEKMIQELENLYLH